MGTENDSPSISTPAAQATGRSISIIITALNEAKHLARTVEVVTETARRHFDAHEIIVVNDGSTDETGAIAENLKARFPSLRVLHNDRPLCMGGAFKRGLAAASMTYVTRVNGKNDTTVEELGKIWSLRGQADMIIAYSTNFRERPLARRLVSRAFTIAVNLLFGLRLRYFNHYTLHRRALLQSIRIRTCSYAWDAEALVKLIKRGHSYLEVGHLDCFDHDDSSKAFHPRNVFRVLTCLLWLVWDIHLARRYRS